MFSEMYKNLYKRFRRVKNRAYGYVYLPNYNNKAKIEVGSDCSY